MRASTLPYELIVAAAFLLFCIGAVLYVGDVSVFPYVLGGPGSCFAALTSAAFYGPSANTAGGSGKYAAASARGVEPVIRRGGNTPLPARDFSIIYCWGRFKTGGCVGTKVE